MNTKRIHQTADLATSIYRIMYTSFLMYYLLKRRSDDPPSAPPLQRRRKYH
jgi:hypothetical protein